MIEKMGMITSFFSYPFAIYKEKDCLFDHNLQLEDHVFIEKYGRDTAEFFSINIHYSEGDLFSVTPFSYRGKLYTFVVRVLKADVDKWQEKEWRIFKREVTTVVMIIQNEEDLNVVFVEEKKEKVIPATIELREFWTEVDFIDHYQLEKQFIKEIKNGSSLKSSKILGNIRKIHPSPLSENKVLDVKYRVISLITLLTRSAIQEGCSPNVAYRLSDELIQKLDTLETLEDSTDFSNKAVYEFKKLMFTNSYRYSSDIVNKAVEYIYRNIYEKIQNKDIAACISANPSYLSATFKKHTHMSLRQFINHVKIDEAKFLLRYTDVSFKDISESLHFSNQSHFCRLFKELTKFSPKEYRSLF